jgi:hypothetical protein
MPDHPADAEQDRGDPGAGQRDQQDQAEHSMQDGDESSRACRSQ